MITIINYGLGNINAFANIYTSLNFQVTIAQNADELEGATRIILPGVGSFDHAMSLLNRSGMRDRLDKLVLHNKVPVTGICLGMQIMANRSEEGKMNGLGWIDGEVKIFDIELLKFKTRYPHMGWNSISPAKHSPILNGLPSDARFYFLHSYYFDCNNPDDILTYTTYGIKYASAINHENIFGIQFHPEKSHANGIRLLKNFATL